jgi:hypothetical protein
VPIVFFLNEEYDIQILYKFVINDDKNDPRMDGETQNNSQHDNDNQHFFQKKSQNQAPRT